MSSDLWNAFVDDFGDLSENPWAQQLQGDRDVDKHQRDTNPTIVALSTHETIGQPGISDGCRIPEAAWNGSSHPEMLLSGIVEGNVSDIESDNVWTAMQSSGRYHQPMSNSFQHTSMNSTDICLNDYDVDDDEFGDFEVSKTFSSGEEIKPELLATTPISFTKGQSTNNETLNAHKIHDPLFSETQSNKPYDTLGSLKNQAVGVPKARTSQIKEAKRPSPDVWTQASKPKQSTDDVSYKFEDWGEFSSESRHSPSFQEQQAIPIRVRQELTPPAVTHSPSLSQSLTKDLVDPSLPQPKPPPTSLPPSNIPPPSLLILRLSTLVQTLPGQVDNVLQSLNSKQISQKALDKALRSCIASLRVAARIIEGRKLRWKRDSHLSQSMSIGPAQGAKKGMKLTSVDRGESEREGHQVVEFVRVWKHQLGNIRGALASINSQISGNPLTLPEITESMGISMVKATEGARLDLKGCVLCGLKRNELVNKVDVDIWDTFGEWWTDLWGHTECKQFWEEHQTFLSISSTVFN